MFTIPNQSSLPTALKQFEDEGGDGSGMVRLLPSENWDRLVDCMEGFVKYTIFMRPHFELFGDRLSERRENPDKQMKNLTGKKNIVDKIYMSRITWKTYEERWDMVLLQVPCSLLGSVLGDVGL